MLGLESDLMPGNGLLRPLLVQLDDFLLNSLHLGVEHLQQHLALLPASLLHVGNWWLMGHGGIFLLGAGGGGRSGGGRNERWLWCWEWS